MTSPSSRRVHLSENTKRILATLPHARKMDFTRALERVASDPTPDGDSKAEIGFPYESGVRVFGGEGFQFVYKVGSDDSVRIGAIWHY